MAAASSRGQLRDFWDAFDVHRLQVRLEVLGALEGVERAEAMVGVLVPDPLSPGGAEAVQHQRDAMLEGKLREYANWLSERSQAVVDAGASWTAWFRSVAAFRAVMLGRLSDAYRHSPPRFAAAALGLGTLVDAATHAFGAAFNSVASTSESAAAPAGRPVESHAAEPSAAEPVEPSVAKPPLSRPHSRRRESKPDSRGWLSGEAPGPVDPATFLRGALGVSTQPLFAVDVEGHVVSWNAAAARVYGYTEEEIVGRDIMALFSRGRRDDLEAIARAIEEGTPVSLATHHVAKEGRAFDTQLTMAPIRNVDGQLIGAAAVAREVDDGWAAQPAVRELLDTLPIPLLVADADCLVVVANRAAESLLGYDRSALTGGPVELLVPEGSEEGAAALRGAFTIAIERQAGSPIDASRTLKVQRADGTEVEITLSLSRFDVRDRSYVLAILDWDSALAEAEHAERLERTLAELERSNQELEQFAYVASHDLQEPLRMVGSYTELLRERYAGKIDDEADTYIGFAVDGARRMQQMVSDLLEFSRVGSRPGSFVPTNVEKVLQSVLNDLGMSLEEADAEVDVGELPTVVADPVQLGQLFQNLVGNAVKFRKEHVRPRVVVTAEQDDSQWVFRVEDNGIGLDPRFAERIFGMFQRLHPRDRYEGTGIGLAISERIVARHGGRIWVESEVGRGSTFCFSMPFWRIDET